jgi:hypothetical protein
MRLELEGRHVIRCRNISAAAAGRAGGRLWQADATSAPSVGRTAQTSRTAGSVNEQRPGKPDRHFDGADHVLDVARETFRHRRISCSVERVGARTDPIDAIASRDLVVATAARHVKLLRSSSVEGACGYRVDRRTLTMSCDDLLDAER